MLSHKRFFTLVLSLAIGVFAAQDQLIHKRGLQPRAPAVTITSILPTKSIVSPPDAKCTVTYTTVLPSLGTNPGGVPTRVADHTYTMEYGCKGSSGSPCAIPSDPAQLPPGFTVTTKICDKCANGPATYTLTVPDTAAETDGSSSGSGSWNSHGSGESGHGSPHGGAGTLQALGSKPTNVPGNAGNAPTDESTGDASGGSASESDGDSSSKNGDQGGNVDDTGSGGAEESGSTETVGVSAASSIKFELVKAWEMLFLTVLFMGMNM
ncbi:hypothetical protein CC79DRAFT_1222741 [Sarocladium strictum]